MGHLAPFFYLIFSNLEFCEASKTDKTKIHIYLKCAEDKYRNSGQIKKGGLLSVDKKMRDKNVVKEGVNDPAFYNDQIDKNKEPMRASMQKDKNKDKNCKCQNGL
jgi:hypothetical protein